MRENGSQSLGFSLPVFLLLQMDATAQPTALETVTTTEGVIGLVVCILGWGTANVSDGSRGALVSRGCNIFSLLA